MHDSAELVSLEEEIEQLKPLALNPQALAAKLKAQIAELQGVKKSRSATILMQDPRETVALPKEKEALTALQIEVDTLLAKLASIEKRIALMTHRSTSPDRVVRHLLVEYAKGRVVIAKGRRN
jgi:hypothetical protein